MHHKRTNYPINITLPPLNILLFHTFYRFIAPHYQSIVKNDHLAFSENENIVKQHIFASTDVPDRKISSKSDLDTANLPKYDSDLINSLPDPISVLCPIYLFEQKNNDRLKMNEENDVTRLEVKLPPRSKSARRAHTPTNFMKKLGPLL